jgi:uncharacterized membrane protein YbhN (UPF0104 family)
MQTLGLLLAIFKLDPMTVWLAFNAVGEVPALWVVFASFASASMVTTIGPIPVGLGTFEATSVGMLSLLGVATRPDLLAADVAWPLAGTARTRPHTADHDPDDMRQKPYLEFN